MLSEILILFFASNHQSFGARERHWSDLAITLSRLVEEIEQGLEREIVIARNGRPAAKLVPIDTAPPGKRIGVAKGVFVVPDSIDAHNDDIALLFMGEEQS